MAKVLYYLGLDMGTSSIGWAVTDENYQILRARGKDLWGIREFEEANTSAERRVNRTSRRRRQREVARLGLVKEFFSKEIDKIDPQFFARVENSKYWEEDKDEELASKKYILFNDPDFTDADYYKKYPTIFHLRKELLENANAPYDVRLVYLAVSNMFKHRGHFLLSGVEGTDGSEEIDRMYDEMCGELADNYDVKLLNGKSHELIAVLSDTDLSRTHKLDKLKEIFKVQKSDAKTIAFLKMMCGLKVDVTAIFDVELEDKYSICFHDFSYSDKIPEIMEKVGDDNYSVIERMKKMYDYAALDSILKGHGSLSEARVELYEKHHRDLELLKKVYKEKLSQDDYDKMFRSHEDGTYSAYVKSSNSKLIKEDGKYRRNMGKRSKEDLYAAIKADFKKCEADEDIQYILEEIDKESFLPKQLTGANGIIPNQVHKKELVKILKNAKEYLPFLDEKDEKGISVADKIVQLFSFQIPYYVGPVGENSATGWAVRKESGPVYPWNIEDKIDMEKTSAEFIERLIRTCTYLNGEKVMPKASLLYEKFCVLNEINNIRVEGERISVELKQNIYRELFQTGKKVTRKQLCNYLMAQGVIQSPEQVTGIDVNLNNSLSSYGKMYAIFDDKLKEDNYQQIAEEIIRYGTIYGDSKEMFCKTLQKYVDDGTLSAAQVKRIAGYKFRDWARFSRALLEMQGCDKSTGEMITLIHAMWDNNLNFMELINSKDFTFKEELENKRTVSLKTLSDFTFEDLDDYYFSAPVKRMVWQTLLIIKELESVLGGLPERIFIEMTRTDEEKGDKGRKNSRGKDLLEKYKSIANTANHEWKTEIQEADKSGKLRSKKLYLYYTQMGCDAYTGEPIDLERLFTNEYDIDHIYPRHYVKDDSIMNNLVLVNKAANEHLKKDIYPIPAEITSNPKVRQLWDMLHQKNLITDEKYKRLTSRTPFSNEQMAGFIARQMVETGQGTKGVADLLQQLTQTTIVYSKAENVSDFRRDNGFVKSRLVNEFHHANDAYLNIVVGNVYFTKFTQNPMNFIAKEYEQNREANHYNLARMFDWNVQRNGKIAWIRKTKENEGTIATVRKMMEKNSPIMTRMNFEQRGAIANATLYSAKKAKPENYIPLKSSDEKMKDVQKYGGFTSTTITYYFIVEHIAKKKKVISIEGVPLYMKDKIEKSETGLLDYCTKTLGLVEPRILLPKLKIQSLLKINGYYYHLSGKTGNQLILRNAVNLCLDTKWIAYVKQIEKYVEQGILSDKINAKDNEKLYDVLTDKFVNGIYSRRFNPVGDKLLNGRGMFIELTLEQQCRLVYQILQLFKIGITFADLTMIKGAGKAGGIFMNKIVNLSVEFCVINQSITGLYESEIDLLTL